MTIILCPKFNQHNLSGPSSGGKFLLETKKQKKTKKRNKEVSFSLEIPGSSCPCIICILNQPNEVPQAGR